MAEPNSAKSIFLEASEMPSAERAAYLEQAVGGDAELRARVVALLKAHDNPDSFLAEPVAGFGATADLSPTEAPIVEKSGTVIGPYKLLQQIGEGGMGVVFMAEQTEPIQRTVALKIIKPGMDTRQVIARFEAERQALALMDHPNIARVIDAGTTDTGRPYFVMELVKGFPITKYCDDHQFSIRERLELFKPVCEAVQHAHQKGIIHRDLKPTNVLVAEYDNRAVPKVIDFGVAKATAQKLTERTMFTEFGQVIGTVEYMSPERAKLNQLDVDTRSDIYSLGVLLYELLAGSTPLEKERLRAAAFDEILRIIREEDPPPPSTRLSSSDALPSIAANRSLEPTKLTGQISGELDWIVMKCLEKDRSRRYETATGIAHDIDRYLNDEPVEACPPSAAYRFRKFARRNKIALSTATIVLLASLLAVGSIGWTIRDRSARVARFNYGVDVALNEVTRTRDGILKHMENPFEWDTALAAATAALNGANELAAQSPSALDSATAARLVAHRKTIQADQLDHRFVMRLDEILRDIIVWDATRNKTTHEETFRALQSSFKSCFGWTNTTPIEEVADFLRTRPPAVQQHLLVAFDVALACAPEQRRQERQWLTNVLNAIDPSPWREQAREALAARDWPALEQLFQDVKLSDDHPARLYMLASHLPESAAKGEVFSRISEAYPGEAWAHGRFNTALSYHVLAWQLLVPPELKYDDGTRAVKWAQSATRLVANDGDFWYVLALAYGMNENWKEARAAADKAIELSGGGDNKDWFIVAVTEGGQGNLKSARKWYDKAVRQMEDKHPNDPELRYFRDKIGEHLHNSETSTSDTDD